MEDCPRIMHAMKTAYPDVILNTAKEAADQIMAFELKPLVFQPELLYAKYRALRMLLRLKHMIDSKTKETELASSCQQKKIEELESQLHEAEDVITDIRMELKQARDQVEKGKKNLLQPLDETSVENNASNTNLIPELVLYHSLSLRPETIISNSPKIPMDQGVLDSKLLTDSLLENNYAHAETASVILRRKEPEPYRNDALKGFL